MSLEFDIACLRAPCEPCDTMGVVQLIARAKMAADQLEELTAQRDELLAALRMITMQGVSDQHIPIEERFNRHVDIARAAVEKYNA